MRALTATGPVRRLRLSAVVCLSLVFQAPSAAQPFPFGFGQPTPADLTPPRVEVVSGPTAARLEQARALAANENWDEAVDTYRDLMAEDTERLVPLGENRFVSLRAYCHGQLAGLPAEALAAYRRQVDPLAERLYRDGATGHDEAMLERVVEEFYCSSWGDDALLALGELALERADYPAARGAWEQISPLLRSPHGLPPWLALRDIDLNAHWPAVERRWLARAEPPSWLAYPDTQFDLADVRARLVLASIRAGQRDRAALELAAFRRFHPQAVGRLGGQEGPYADVLERLLTSAEEWPAEPRDATWPTFAGSPSRAAVAPPLSAGLAHEWEKPIDLTPPEFARAPTRINIELGGPFGGLPTEEPPVAVRESQRPLCCFPIGVDDTIVYGDAAGIHALDAATGRPAITADGFLHRNDSVDELHMATHFGAGAAFQGVPRYTLTAAAGVVYGRTGRLATTQLGAGDNADDDRLVGLDLSRDGLLTFRARPPEAGWSFDGVPVGDGRRLFVAMRRSDVTPHAYVACYDAATGLPRWRTPVGSAESPAAGRGDEITHNLLTLVGNRIYFNTNLGLVAALDVEDGRICWLHRYERGNGTASRPLHLDRDPAPCLYHEGLLIVAPADSSAIFALDAFTGRMVWTSNKLPDALHLLGVVQQNLIVAGHRLAALDVRSGSLQWVWPESEHAGIRGMGRGLVAGEEVYWPTRNEIYVLHALTGRQTRTPISLRGISDGGANLVAANGRLIAAGHDKLMAFGSP